MKIVVQKEKKKKKNVKANKKLTLFGNFFKYSF